ncbi:metal-sulfur cluster assembly factor [Haloarchaeobius amylolyticus]|uniref:Metal-sulfur cluster assembly factor n=1 Tax=Haloarchaeobius amylolyticus TaxID=1198296 RepID=A0ABD6BCZ1_9EURY
MSAPKDPATQIAAADPVEQAVWKALRTVEDPELPVSIVDLGLVYAVSVEDGEAVIDIILTYSGCPACDLIVMDAEKAVQAVSEVETVTVDIVHSPPWSFERVTDRGRHRLNQHGLTVPDGEALRDPECH